MDSNWAADQLQVIRTLMERSALYRRALAPIMIYNGLLGLGAGLAGWQLGISSVSGFVGFWTGVAVLGLTGSFLLVRRQAIKDSEPFWSPPTRRVAMALLPAMLVGTVLGALAGFFPARNWLPQWLLVSLWICLYGCALSAAGFFMARGIRLLGWAFVAAGSGLVCFCCLRGEPGPPGSGHLAMAAAFGGMHLAYGIYLYFTEQRGNAA